MVLSASVCTRQGKALVSRQFVEMNRLRVEGLLAAFPKLIGHNGKTQHTYVETDSVRYIYQPLENQMYLLLITTKSSNIVEDLGTLRLLAKVVPDVAGGWQEQAIADHAFDLIFAMDEVLTAGGYKEEATNLSLIKSNLIMDSHEEKIHLALKQSKEEQAKEHMRKQEKIIKDRKMAQLRHNLVQGGGGGGADGPSLGGMQGFGGGGPGPGAGGGWADAFNPNAQQQQQQQAPQEYNPYAALQQPQPTVDAPKVLAKSGLKLGGGGGGMGGGGANKLMMGGKKENLMAAMAAEDNLFGSAAGGGAAGAGKSIFDMGTAPAKPVVTHSTPVSLVLEEKISVQMNREGGIESCELKGILTLTANTEAGAMAVVQVNKNVLPPSYSYATHPKVDKKPYEQSGSLSLKGDKGFPVSRGIGILRWSYSGEDAAPLTVNCWPEEDGAGAITVNIEMELTRKDLVLHDVNILLPLGTTDPPVVESLDGQYKHDPRAGMMCWHFDVVDASHSSGAMEFSIPGSDPDAFFPIHIGFRSETLLCPIQVTGVANSTNGTPIPNQIVKSFVPDSYQCA